MISTHPRGSYTNGGHVAKNGFMFQRDMLCVQNLFQKIDLGSIFILIPTEQGSSDQLSQTKNKSIKI